MKNILPSIKKCTSSIWKTRFKKKFYSDLRLIQKSARTRQLKKKIKCEVCGSKTAKITYRYKGWVWDNSVLHYVIKHNVRPSKKFFDFITHEASKINRITKLKNFENISIAVDHKCPKCRTNTRLLLSYRGSVATKCFCNCGAVFQYKLILNGDDDNFKIQAKFKLLKQRGKKQEMGHGKEV